MNRRIEIVMDTTGGYSPDVMPRLVLAADAMHTPVKIVCGTWDTMVYVDRISNRHRDSISPNYYYNIIDTTNHFYSVSIYGDVSFLSSRGDMNLVKKYDFTSNNAMRVIMSDSNMNCNSILLGSQPLLEVLTFGHTNLGDIDIDSCPSLKMLGCHYTNFSSQAYDELMCRLPERLPSDSAKFFVCDGGNRNADASFFAATSQNALCKNWTLCDRRSGAVTVRTTGTNICPVAVRKIRLKVQPDSVLVFNFSADSSNSPIRIVSGSTDTTIVAGTNLAPRDIQVLADSVYMDIFGDLNEFRCYDNHNVTSLDISQNPYMKKIDCRNSDVLQVVFGGANRIETLILFQCRISAIDLRSCVCLDYLNCGRNNITSLDVSYNQMLTHLICKQNGLTSLDVSNNRQLKNLGCANNRIPFLDVSANTALEWFVCYGNPMSASALDDMMCALPSSAQWGYGFMPACNAADSTEEIYSANVQNARLKGWFVYDTIFWTIYNTNGTYICPAPASKIRLQTQPGNNITFNVAADTANTPIRVVNGSFDTTIFVDTVFGAHSMQFISTAVYFDVYGDVKAFQLLNQDKVYSIYLTENSLLKKLDCRNNAVNIIEFPQLSAIEELDVTGCRLSVLNLHRCPFLKHIDCRNNAITIAYLSQLPILETFNCANNRLTALDISNNPLLADFDCSNNSLASLNFTANTAIESVICYGNNLTSSALDEMMCSLPAVNSGVLVPMRDVADSNDAFYDANVRNAIAKHWSVFDSNNTQVLSTNGTYVCSQGIGAPEHSRLTITPNPAKGSVTVGGMEGDTEIRIIDLQGRTLIRQRATAGTAVIDIRELESGIYFLKTDYSCEKLIVK